MLWNISPEYKNNNIFIRIFFIMFSVFPIGWALINAVRYWWVRDHSSKIIILSGIILLLGVAVYILRQETITKKEEIISVVFVTLLALMLRYMMVELLDTYPYSDPINAFITGKRLAAGKEVLAELKGYYSVYPHWGAWAIVLGGVMRVFGQNLEAARNFCVILSAFNAPIYYCVVKLICKNVKIAKLSMIFIAISPGAICYSGVLMNDHMSEFFVGFFFLFFAMAHRKREENEIKKAIFYYVIASICLGLFHYFKLVGIVILLATMIGEFVMNIVPEFMVLVRGRDWKRFLVNCVTSLGLFLILFCGYKGTVSLMNVFYENVMGVEIQETNYSVYASLHSGLNIETKGKHSREIQAFRNLMWEKYPDVKERNQVYKELVIENVTENTEQILDVLVYKFGDAWGSQEYSGEQAFITGSMRYDEKVSENVKVRYEEGYKFILPVLKNMSAVFWSVLLIGAMLGAVCCVWKKCDYTFLISMIYVFGFALMLEMIIVQGRYKDVLYLPLAMLSAYGLCAGKIIIEKVINSKRRR